LTLYGVKEKPISKMGVSYLVVCGQTLRLLYSKGMPEVFVFGAMALFARHLVIGPITPSHRPAQSLPPGSSSKAYCTGSA